MGRSWASADRTAYVFDDGDALVAVQGGKRHRIAIGTGCLTDGPDYLFVSGDGRRAVALGWRATGGSIHHNVQHEVSVACVLDLTSGATTPLDQVYPGLPPGDDPSDGGRWAIGAHTGFVYRREVPGPHADVYDVKGGEAQLALPLGNNQCDIVERTDAIVVACARYRQTSSGNLPRVPPSYRYWVDLAELDPTSFPPPVRSSRELDVSRADDVRLSRDGRTLAWWYAPYDEPSTGAVVDVASGRTITAIGGAVAIVDVDFSPDGGQLAILEQASGDSRHAVVRRVTLAGSPSPAGEPLEFSGDAADLFWLASGDILVSGYGKSALIHP